MFRLFVLLSLGSLVSGGRIITQHCDENQIGSDVTLEVEEFPDDTSTVTLIKGKAYNFKITFTSGSGSNSATLTNKLFGVIAGMEIPWNGVDGNACSGLTGDGKCPLVSTTRYTYQNQLSVKKFYPAIKLNIIWKLVDAAGGNQVCFKLPAEIKNALEII